MDIESRHQASPGDVPLSPLPQPLDKPSKSYNGAKKRKRKPSIAEKTARHYSASSRAKGGGALRHHPKESNRDITGKKRTANSRIGSRSNSTSGCKPLKFSRRALSPEAMPDVIRMVYNYDIIDLTDKVSNLFHLSIAMHSCRFQLGRATPDKPPAPPCSSELTTGNLCTMGVSDLH